MREVIADLEARADGHRGDPSRVIAEAEYQLALCYLDGYGVQQSVQRGLQYFHRSFNSCSIKALRAGRNFYEAFEREFPADMETTEKFDLLSLAQVELASFDTLKNPFVATGALYFRYPSIYESLICSDEYRDSRLQQYTGRAVRYGVTTDDKSLDDIVSGLCGLTISRPYGPTFDSTNPVESTLRALAAIHELGPGNLTMLHHAAARGDSRLVNLLLRLKADVNSLTPHFGWTPLWMACEGGYYDVAVQLLAHGADIGCRETTSGRSVLHLLSRFRTSGEVGYMFEKAQDSELQVDDIHSRGVTPLLAAFIGWDISRGIAARMLLKMGSNPLMEDHQGRSPLSVCVDQLNNELLRAMLSCPALEDVPNDQLWEAMADALRLLISQPSSIQISRLGKRREPVIKDLLLQLTNDGSTQKFLRQMQTRYLSPLTAATWLGKTTLAMWLLELRPDDIDLHGAIGRTALQLAIVRNQSHLVQLYVDHGADPLICNDLGNNALHVAAVSMPSVIALLADAVVRIHCAGDCTVAKSLLEGGNIDGYSPFAMAVFEGSEEHIRSAEALRSRYLEHGPWDVEASTTLLGKIILTGAIADISNVSQVKYLLGLTPKSKFFVDAQRSTLLHLAVMGWKNGKILTFPVGLRLGLKLIWIQAEYFDGPIGFEILALLLKEFPTLEHIEALDANGCTPLMTAASFGNHLAIKKIRDHATTCSLSLHVNTATSRGATALDLVGGGALMTVLGVSFVGLSPAESIECLLSKRPGELDSLTLQLMIRNIRRTKQLLLQMGAARYVYITGITVW